MKTRKMFYWMVAAMGSMAIAIACSKSGNNGDDLGNGDGSGGDKTSDSIKLVTSSNLGMIMTDGAGRTLYFFSIDADGNSGCTDGCTAAWPTYYIKAPKIGAGLAASDFGTITRKDGNMQTTYKGWPLYYYAEDAKAGDIKGDGFGGKWFVAKADYAVMLSNKVSDQTVVYMTDAVGNTLYAYAPDKSNTNMYTKPDFSNNAVWPIDTTVTTIGSIPSTLKKDDFKIITVFGKSQLTYKGWPLYYYGPDNGKRGDIKGESTIWPLVNSSSAAAPN